MNDITTLRMTVLNDLLVQIKVAAQLMLEQPDSMYFRRKLDSLIKEYDSAIDASIFEIHAKYFGNISTLKEQSVNGQ